MIANYSWKKTSLLYLFERFIRDSKKGRRVMPNGRRISKETVENYSYTLVVLKKFCISTGFLLRIIPVQELTARELIRERNYWNLFYNRFNDFMYNELGYFDGYSGLHIKNLRTFFNYLARNLGLPVGDFHKSFYVRKPDIAIFPLTPKQLYFLIYNTQFENSLSPRMKQVKDFFVFGCTVGLRFSDLKALRMSNLKIVNEHHYLVVRSKKTDRESVMKLPAYALTIIARYSRFKKALLPDFNNVNLNIFIKRLLELAGFTQPVTFTRDRRGKFVELRKPLTGKKYNRFCDVATTHTMRRTAITTMLTMGVPEQVVRQISGHSPGSKEFYRYVVWSQTYQDKEVDKMFERLHRNADL